MVNRFSACTANLQELVTMAHSGVCDPSLLVSVAEEHVEDGLICRGVLEGIPVAEGSLVYTLHQEFIGRSLGYIKLVTIVTQTLRKKVPSMSMIPGRIASRLPSCHDSKYSCSTRYSTG